MKKGIAFFDFDGTLTKNDTLLEIIRFQKGKLSFSLGFLICSPILLAYKIGLISNSTAKQQVLQYFFGGDAFPVFQSSCDRFAEKILPNLLRHKAMAEIEKLKGMEIQVVIVSASAENWIKKWADSIEAELVATRLEIVDQRITGKFSGKNCHGREKAERIRAVYDLSAYGRIYCYGDTRGDREMLALGDISYYKPFR